MVKALRPRTTYSLSKYGLTQADWLAILEEQGGACIICGKGGKTKHLSVDHDHTLQKLYGIIMVRGLICQRCNRAIGAFEYDDIVLSKAIKYLGKIITLRARVRKENMIHG